MAKPRLLVLEAARDSLTEEQREALRYVSKDAALGNPTRVKDDQGNVWLCYEDARLTEEDFARGAKIMANAQSFPDFQPKGKGHKEVYEEDKRFARDKGVVLPDSVPHTPGTSRLQELLDANGAPASMKAGNGLPRGWTRLGGRDD